MHACMFISFILYSRAVKSNALLNVTNIFELELIFILWWLSLGVVLIFLNRGIDIFCATLVPAAKLLLLKPITC